MPERRFRLVSSPCKVVVSVRFPRSTSRWMGMPSVSVATDNALWYIFWLAGDSEICDFGKLFCVILERQ